MSCILRVSGEFLDIDTLLSEHPLVVDRTWKKGEPRTLKGKFHSDSGANFAASVADLDEFDRQVADAIEFLELHALTLAKIVLFPGVQISVLDFGVALNEGYVAQFSYFPPKFLQLAASAGVGVEISHYACGKDEEED